MLSLVLAAAEPSKTPFYIAGVLLVLWAGLLAGLGLSRPTFPANDGASRGVMGISVILAIAAVLSGILTSAFPH